MVSSNFRKYGLHAVFLSQHTVFPPCLQISENEDYIGYVVLLFGNSRKPCSLHFAVFISDIRENPENEPFLRPKKCFWVVLFAQFGHPKQHL